MDRHATAVWKGTLKEGPARSTRRAARCQPCPIRSRRGSRTRAANPAPIRKNCWRAAHAGCFAMQLSHFLAENGTPAEKLDAKAVVTLVPGTGITGSAITLVGTVPGIDAAKFKELADKAKAGCPVSQALGAIKVSLDASLA